MKAGQTHSHKIPSSSTMTDEPAPYVHLQSRIELYAPHFWALSGVPRCTPLPPGISLYSLRVHSQPMTWFMSQPYQLDTNQLQGPVSADPVQGVTKYSRQLYFLTLKLKLLPVGYCRRRTTQSVGGSIKSILIPTF